jgi:dienelactone hydrolase
MYSTRARAGSVEAQRMQDLQRLRVAVPSSGRGRGVLVIAAGGGGAERHARDACDRLARGGFVAAAAWVADAAGAPGAAERAAVDAGIEQLFCEHATEGPRVGLVGFGRGALLALDAAARGARVAAVIALDPRFETAWLDAALPRIDAFVLAVCAEKEAGEAGVGAADLDRRLRGEGVPCDVRSQPGVGSGFLDEACADRYDAVAARAAWDAAFARLRAEL